MEFDYYADHSIAAAAVVAYADIGGVVARVDHHRVVFVSTADVGDVLSGLLNDDGLVVILFSLHVFSESAGQAGLHFSRSVAALRVVVASMQGFTTVVNDLAVNDRVGVEVAWQGVVAGVVVSPGSNVLLCLFSSPLVKNGVVLGAHLDCLNAGLSPEAVDYVQGCLTELALAAQAVVGADLNSCLLGVVSLVGDVNRLVLGL